MPDNTACCGCGGLICDFPVIARQWTFTVNGILNNSCNTCAGFNGFHTITYADTGPFQFGSGWFSEYTPLQCYDAFSPTSPIWHWRMICDAVTGQNPNPLMRLQMFPILRTNFCGFGQDDQADEWSIARADFNPVGVNILQHTSIDNNRGCIACNAVSVGDITITPVL